MSKVSLVVHRHVEMNRGPYTKSSRHLKYAVQVNCWQQELCLSIGRRTEPAGAGIALAVCRLWQRLQAERRGCPSPSIARTYCPFEVNLLCHSIPRLFPAVCCSTAEKELFHVAEVRGRHSFLFQEHHKNCFESCCLGYWLCCDLQEVNAIPKMLISWRTGLKALAHKVEGDLNHMLTIDEIWHIVTAKDSSWHARTLPHRKVF